MFKGIKKTPEDGIKFKDMIHAMIQADKENFKGKYSETIRNTAIERNIIRPDDKI